jgi:hypothetical protein
MAVDEQYAQALRELDQAKGRAEQWRQAALAFELRAMRVEMVIRLLVAAGHVTQEKVDQAFSIAGKHTPAAVSQEKP